MQAFNNALEPPLLTERLQDSWRRNAGRWTEMVRHPVIIRERSVVYSAVLAAVLRLQPKLVLDLGCGKGWLCRELSEHGIDCIGIDAVDSLIEAARRGAGGDSRFFAYEEIAKAPSQLGVSPDVLVANFSLLDEEAPQLLNAMATIAHEATRLIIQAAHPIIAGAGAEPGWRLELFNGHRGGLWVDMPWYFRSLSSWEVALKPTWRLELVEEPKEAGASQPSSLLLTAIKG
ncbi:methyltransferase domain-containing protein [Phenylobacterium sp.]|uniref:class I SAM-dependent methyltransferase n=1 Tax=Phenylobacterium sp. TaxID=1871053 RepID=UPI0025D94004|nr:methyltransferase domain-containing protein [Phenylobacterium sp.]